MKHVILKQINRDTFKESHLTEEDLFKEMARKLVSEIPIEELKKIIKFTKNDPLDKLSEEHKMHILASTAKSLFNHPSMFITYKGEINLP